MPRVHFANTSDSDLQMNLPEEGLAQKEGDTMLRLNPSESIVFKSGEHEHDLTTGTVEIISASEKNVTYKIKTTSPEKFLVRPSSGVLAPGKRVKITVTLQRGHQVSPTNKDKFLVMCMVLPDDLDQEANGQQITDIWKSKPSHSGVEQHRLRCVGYHNQGDGGMKNGHISHDGDDSNLDRKVTNLSDTVFQLYEHNVKLEKQLKFSQNLQWITLFMFMLFSVAIVYILKLEINEHGAAVCVSKHSEL